MTPRHEQAPPAYHLFTAYHSLTGHTFENMHIKSEWNDFYIKHESWTHWEVTKEQEWRTKLLIKR